MHKILLMRLGLFKQCMASLIFLGINLVFPIKNFLLISAKVVICFLKNVLQFHSFQQNVHKNIKFTMEQESNGELAFLNRAYSIVINKGDLTK